MKKINHNPYDLVPLLLNGIEAYGRPIAFDSEIVDQRYSMNASGKYVKPTKVVASCNVCGSYLELEVNLGDPPFQPFECYCQCSAPVTIPPMPDPFLNPLKDGRITAAELDPLLIDKIVDDPVGTVAERIAKSNPKAAKSTKNKKPSADDEHRSIHMLPVAPDGTDLEAAIEQEEDKKEVKNNDYLLYDSIDDGIIDE